VAPDAPAAERVLVLAPRAAPEAKFLALGATEWVRGALAGAGVESDPEPARGPELEPGRAVALPGADALRALRQGRDEQRAWTLDLRIEDGEATVRILLVELESGALAAAGRATSPVAGLGEALAEAVRSLAGQAGLTSPPLPIPTVAELDRYGRALTNLERQRLGDAWHELLPKRTTTADSLRERIAGQARSAQTPLGERARISMGQGDTARVRLWLRTELGTSQEASLFLAAAETAEELGDFDRALSSYERVATMDPDSGIAATGRVRVLANLGRTHDAATLAEQLPDSADPLDLERILDTPGFDASQRASLHLLIARLAERRFDAETASAHLGSAAESDPALEGAAQERAALLHVAFGRTEEARSAAERATELGSAQAPVWEIVARARQQSGDVAGATLAFEHARELAPSRPEPLAGLAQLAVDAGDHAKATELAGQALALGPRGSGTRLQLAGLLRITGRVDEALSVLEGGRPGEADARMLREAAAIRLERGDAKGAVLTLDRAAEIEPEDGALHEELARAYEASGNAEAAAAARQRAARAAAPSGAASAVALDESSGAAATASPESFAALVASFPTELPGHDAPIAVVALLPPSQVDVGRDWLRWLRPRRLDLAAVGRALAAALGEHYEVVAPGEIPRELGQADQEALRALAEDEETVARMNHALGADAVFAARVSHTSGEALHVELRMSVGSEPTLVRRFRNEALVQSVDPLTGWNPSALVIYSLALVLACLPLLRGWGELVVGIQYTSLGKGFFSIRLSRRPERADAGGEEGTRRQQRARRRTSLMGRYQRDMVDRETHFRFLPARRYYVSVHGLLQDPTTEEVVGNYLAEQSVVVQRGRSARLDFDFRPKECAVEVSVFRGRDPQNQATVALRGRTDSLRYLRNGRTLLYLAPGQYRILVGLEDRVLERELSIEGFAPRALSFDVLDESMTLFADCPAAVEPYLTGNFSAAAAALEQAGHTVEAARIRGEQFAERGDMEQAARCFQEAGRFAEAAALVDGHVDPAAAARLYEQAGDHDKAAQAWRQAGEPARAAEHYEDDYRFDDALECYREAGHLEKVCELDEKLAQNLDAARVALELGDVDRAIRNLQAVEVRDIDYGAACQMLAQLFGDRGEHELSVQKLEEAMTTGGGADQASPALLEQYAAALERAGRLEAAITAYESVRTRDFHRPQVAERIEALRAALEAERTVTGPPPGTTRTSESRYELLQEIGRGGMGVVYKARDKRLGRVVALKRLPENLRNHPTAVRLFLREARAAAALNHRNIVTLHDADQEGDVYFLTMEFLEGMSLHEILARRGRLSPRDVVRLAVQAATGLEYAHTSGVVHRDIKTANLFFTKDRVVKIMDFGLAKMAEEVRRATTVVGGTPYYMAPEQAAGADVDHRADLYAFGVTLYELLTGEVPFRQGDLAHHHRHTPPPDPRTKVPDLPPALAELVLRLLAKAPEERFATTAEVVARLQELAKQLAG
jgi:tetratricopeptide (TPR) repeat protein